jgi:hypothetical protein
MIKFMVLGSPRCGTAWAAEWLGAVHDPLWDWFYTDLDALNSGISCTGLAMFYEWVNRHACPKVVLHRPSIEVEASLRLMGLPMCPPELFHGLDEVKGLHVPWTDLWANPEPIWKHLIGEGFDAQRHAELRGVNVQCDWKSRIRRANPEVRRRFAAHGIMYDQQDFWRIVKWRLTKYSTVNLHTLRLRA